MLAFVFPGQGSQYRGMGAGCFDLTEFERYEAAADKLLGYSIRKICTENPENSLRQTQFTQPCIYAVNALKHHVARSEGRQPNYVAGHSLGEYNALLAAGAFDFMTGLQLVAKRSTLMAQAKNGGMAAVIGLGADRISAVLHENDISGVDIANYNAPKQIVLSGPSSAMTSLKPVLEKAGAELYLPLPVSGAFHSQQMKAAAAAFSEFLDLFVFNDLKVTVISNVTGMPYPTNEPTTTIRTLLVEQMVRPVRWFQSVQYLLAQGVEEFSELGPGNVLTRLIAQIRTV
jgi:malonyl CoA-acyl carrier protein transacylase